MVTDLVYVSIFWVSTVVTIVGFLFAIRMYKIQGIVPILATGLYLFTSLFWIAQDTSDAVSGMLYDISMIAAIFCVFRHIRSK